MCHFSLAPADYSEIRTAKIRKKNKIQTGGKDKRKEMILLKLPDPVARYPVARYPAKR